MPLGMIFLDTPLGNRKPPLMLPGAAEFGWSLSFAEWLAT